MTAQVAAVGERSHPVYCRSCGAALAYRYERSGYDRWSGALVTEQQWRCPKSVGLWGWLTGDTHDRWSLVQTLSGRAWRADNEI